MKTLSQHILEKLTIDPTWSQAYRSQHNVDFSQSKCLLLIEFKPNVKRIYIDLSDDIEVTSQTDNSLKISWYADSYDSTCFNQCVQKINKNKNVIYNICGNAPQVRTLEVFIDPFANMNVNDL